MTLTRLTPMLHVADVERSLAFYRDHLGFTLMSPESALRDFGWAHIRRDGVDLMLTGGLEGGPLRQPGATSADWPVMFYFYPDDVESLHERIKVVEREMLVDAVGRMARDGWTIAGRHVRLGGPRLG